jgi:outer membrane protein assembly factor BamB
MGVFLQHSWSHNLHQRPNPWSIITPTLALVAERRTWMACIDSPTGAVRWTAKIEIPWGIMAVTPQHVFHLGSNLRCFNRETGDLRWEYISPENYIGNVATTATGVLIGGWRGYTPLRCLDAATGEVRWVYLEIRNMQNPLPGPWGIAVVDVGTRTRDESSATLMLLGEDGTVRRTFPMPAPLMYTDRGTSLQMHADRLITVTRDGGLFLLDPRSDNGWIQIGAHPAGIMTVGRVGSGHTLLFRDGEGRICAFDVRAGALRWVGPPIRHYWDGVQAVELPDGRWIVSSDAGQVILIAKDGAVLAHQTIARRIGTQLALTANGLLVAGTKGTLAGYELRDPAS